MEDAIYAGCAPAVVALANAVRDRIRAADRELEERPRPGWRSFSFHHPDAGYVCGVFPLDDHVRVVFERGTELDDPRGVLEGSGKQVRHLAFRAPSDHAAPVLEELVQQAVAHGALRRLRR